MDNQKQQEDARETAHPRAQPDPKAGYSREPAHTEPGTLAPIGTPETTE
jgi:hypothetical protein